MIFHALGNTRMPGWLIKLTKWNKGAGAVVIKTLVHASVSRLSLLTQQLHSEELNKAMVADESVIVV